MMSVSNLRHDFVWNDRMRSVLALLIWFVAITALSLGLAMVIKPDGVSLGLNVNMLSKTPFSNFLIPGLFLLFVIGGLHLVSIILGIVNHPQRYTLALFSGIVLVACTIAQFLLLHSYNWLSGLYLVLGLLISLISYQLIGKTLL